MKIIGLLKYFGREFVSFLWALVILPFKFLRIFRKTFHLSNLFHYDNIFAIGSLLLFLYALSSIKFELVNPISQAFDDVELTDILFSNPSLEKNKDLRIGSKDNLVILDKNITLVNTGNLNRYEISEVLNFINQYNPRVVALDIFFNDDQADFLDSTLAFSFAKTKNLVFVSRLDSLNEPSYYDNPKYRDENIYASEFKTLEKFSKYGHSGFANMMTDSKSEHMKICREFLHTAISKDLKDTVHSWPVEIVKRYRPEAIEELYKRERRSEIIDFVGNISFQKELLPYSPNPVATFEKPHFYTIDYSQIFNSIQNPNSNIKIDYKSHFENKIVLLGFLGSKIDIEESGEDMFYTPLNEKYVGKAHKDMFGLVIHANIISALLRYSYIDKASDDWMTFIGFITLYLVFASYRPIYDDHKVWYDGLSKFLGIFISMAILFIIGIIFEEFNYQVTFGAIWFGCILLAGDWLEIYYGLIKNIFEKLKESFISTFYR